MYILIFIKFKNELNGHNIMDNVVDNAIWTHSSFKFYKI